MTPTPKIKIVEHKATDGDTWIFSEYDSGMIIGSVKNQSAQFGPDPREGVVRFFVDDAHAILFVRDKCKEYLGRDDVDFFTESANPLVRPTFNMPAGRLKV